MRRKHSKCVSQSCRVIYKKNSFLLWPKETDKETECSEPLLKGMYVFKKKKIGYNKRNMISHKDGEEHSRSYGHFQTRELVDHSTSTSASKCLYHIRWCCVSSPFTLCKYIAIFIWLPPHWVVKFLPVKVKLHPIGPEWVNELIIYRRKKVCHISCGWLLNTAQYSI